MSQTSQPQTIPLPQSLSSHTPSLPTQSQAALISSLRSTGSINELSQLLSDSLARTGWTDRVRALALELLRNGSCDTFPELLEEVMRRAKIPKASQLNGAASQSQSATQASANTNGASTPSASQSQGQNGMNGAGAIAVSKEWTGGPDGLPDVRIPESAVEVGVDFLKDKMRDVVEVVDDDELE